MAATIALRPVDAFGGLQDAAGQTVQRALIHADAIVSDFNTHHALPFASAQPDEAAVLLLADAMFDRVLDDRLHGQGGKPEIRGVDVIHHGEFVAEPHLFQRDVPFDMLQFHCERDRFRSGHGVRIVAHVCGEQAERLFGFVHIRVAHGLPSSLSFWATCAWTVIEEERSRPIIIVNCFFIQLNGLRHIHIVFLRRYI